jgi:hypothetical protein
MIKIMPCSSELVKEKIASEGKRKVKMVWNFISKKMSRDEKKYHLSETDRV